MSEIASEGTSVTRLRGAAGLSLSLLSIAGLWIWQSRQQHALEPTAYTTGWILLGVCVALTLLNLRKKLAALPIGSVRLWLQVHAYLGLVSLGVFAAHAGRHWPRGVLESVLWWLFVLTAVGGVAGLALSRWFAERLRQRGEEVLWERIASKRRELADIAQQTVHQVMESNSVTTLAQFHAERLAGFLSGPRHLVAHVFGNDAPRRALLRELSALHRFLQPEEQAAAQPLATLIERKDDLDFHYALQGALKLWLFAHIGLTAALLVVATVHTLLATAWRLS